MKEALMASQTVILLAVTALAVISQRCNAGPILADPVTHTLVDDQSRLRIFHGVNVVEKIAPFIPTEATFDPQHSMTDTDIKNLRSWGFNVVR